MSAKAQVPDYVQGSWYRDGNVADTVELAGSTAGLLRPDWPVNEIGIGETRWFVCQGAVLYHSVALHVARDVSEIEVTYVDLDLANASVGEYHIYQQAPGAEESGAWVKYLDPGLGNVTQNGDAAALRSRLIIFAPMQSIRIFLTLAPGANANMGVMVSARA